MISTDPFDPVIQPFTDEPGVTLARRIYFERLDSVAVVIATAVAVLAPEEEEEEEEEEEGKSCSD